MTRRAGWWIEKQTFAALRSASTSLEPCTCLLSQLSIPPREARAPDERNGRREPPSEAGFGGPAPARTSKERGAFGRDRRRRSSPAGSWLNIVETLFSKMARTMLRGTRVASKQELIARIHIYYDEINADPVIFRWTYKMDETIVVYLSTEHSSSRHF